MTVWAKVAGLFSGGLDKTIDSAGNLVDKIVTNDGEKQQLKNELTGLITNGFESITSVVRDLALADANGNFLQRSWRPLLLLSFGFVLLINYTIFPMFGKQAVLFPSEFWTFLQIIVPTSVLSRSFDKFQTGSTKGIDLPFIRKRDRKKVIENDLEGTP